MAITHLGAKRLQGTKVDRVVDSLGSSADGTNSGITLIQSATGGTDLTSSSQTYTQVGTTVVKTNDTITATATSASSAGDGTQRVYTALPSTLSNTKHTTDFDLKVTANASSGDPDVTPIMYTAGTDPFHTGNSQDGFGCDIYSDSGNGNNYVMRAIEKNGTDNDYSSGIVLTPQTQYYCRLKRNSSTVGTMEVYTDSARTTHASGSPQTLSITGGTGGEDCTHLQSGAWSQSGSTSYKVENVKLYNDKLVGDTKLGSGAYSLSGTNPLYFANAKDNKLLPETGDFTIACWVKHSGHSDHQQIFRSQDSSGSSKGEFRINHSGTSSQDDRLALALNDGTNGTGGNSATVMTTNAVPQNEWVHLACTRTGATVKLYINGTLETNQNTSGTFSASMKWGNDTPRIGRMENSNETLQGSIDDLAVWHRVLSATEIGKLVNNNVGGDSGWSKTSSNINIQNSRVDFDTTSGGSSTSALSYGIGTANIAGTWVLRGKSVITNYTVGGDGSSCHLFVGFSDKDHTTAFDGSQDSLSFAIGAGTNDDNYYIGSSCLLYTSPSPRDS